MLIRGPGNLRRLIVASCLGLTACVPVTGLDSGRLVAGLSGLILAPDVDCATLRERFRLNYLPVVETPAQVGMPYEEYRVPAGVGCTLRVWYLPADLDRGVVVYSMGTAGNMACYLYSADLLTAHGWSVVMYEYEGFGGSDGSASLSALARDLRCVVDWARQRTGRPRVTLMGMSLGSIPSVAVAVEWPEAVNAVILDSPIALGLLVERLGFVVGGQSDFVLSHLPRELVSEEIVGGLEQPLLIFVHELDPVAPPRAGQLLFDRAAGRRELVVFPGLGHAAAQFEATDAYLYYLETFLTQVWLEEIKAGVARSQAVVDVAGQRQ